jgi:aspartate aminotransferase
MQYAVPDLEGLSIDIGALTRRRDKVMATLSGAGYGVLPPEGTFYMWSRWPEGDPQAMWNALADRDVFVMPGSIMDSPNHFRISLTASDEMVDRALPAFAEAVTIAA